MLLVRWLILFFTMTQLSHCWWYDASFYFYRDAIVMDRYVVIIMGKFVRLLRSTNATLRFLCQICPIASRLPLPVYQFLLLDKVSITTAE